MILCFMSDTHGLHSQVTIPDCDILIHAGDLSNTGKIPQIQDFANWFRAQPAKHKICIGGNHDWALEAFMKEDQEALLRNTIFRNIHYLRDSSVIIDGLKFYGAPWSPRFYDWAFNLDRGPAIKEKWDLIPNDVDVLITHGPPMGFQDLVGNSYQGCADLRIAVARIRPRIHAFGHIHCGAGEMIKNGTRFINAALCNERYEIVNKPVLVEI